MPTLPSVCPLDCPDRCSLEVEVNGAQVGTLRGSRKNPLTAGYICAKVQDFGQRVHGPHRVRHPMRRVGPKGSGQYTPISWEEAIHEVVQKFQSVIATDGAEAILPFWYGGSNGYLTGGGLDARFWDRLGATRILRTLCAANTGAGTRMVYNDLPSADPQDIAEASLVVLWGFNPSASGIHLLPLLQKMQRRGGKLIVVDPIKTPMAARADLHLPLLPGSDVAVAMALHHIAFRDGLADQAFLTQHAADADALAAHVAAWTPARAAEVAGIDASLIEAFAKLYHESQPAIVRCGWGLERNRNGTDAVRAVLALPAVFGKFGVRGGGYVMSTSSGYRADISALQRSAHAPAAPPRTVNMSHLGRLLTEPQSPPIRALYVYDCNPVATLPDQERVLRGLARADLYTVVHEQVWTDTCDYADLVLPATTFLEHHELARSYGGYLLQWSTPVIPPVGEARSNHAVFAALAQGLGWTDDEFCLDEPAWAAAVVDRIPATRGRFDELKTEKVLHLPRPIQFLDCAPARPIQLCTPPLAYEPPPGQEYPIILISPASGRAITSTGYESLPPGDACLQLHPHDAAARGIHDATRIRAYNAHGEVIVTVRIDASVRPGVALLPKGLWQSATHNRRTANALIPDHVDRHGGGACYNDARIEVEPYSPAHVASGNVAAISAK